MKTQLKKYLFEHDLRLNDMATILNCNKAYFCRIVNGLKPGKRLARDIISITDPNMSFDEHIDHKESTKKKHEN